MANIMPETWRDRAFQGGEQNVSMQSTAEVLPAHDAVMTSVNRSTSSTAALPSSRHTWRGLQPPRWSPNDTGQHA